MNLLPGNTPKKFNLLSIGNRGVGKTVFLAGSYAELHSHGRAERIQQLWFDCQDAQVKEKIDRLLSYIAQTGHYPPPTATATAAIAAVAAVLLAPSTPMPTTAAAEATAVAAVTTIESTATAAGADAAVAAARLIA